MTLVCTAAWRQGARVERTAVNKSVLIENLLCLNSGPPPIAPALAASSARPLVGRRPYRASAEGRGASEAAPVALPAEVRLVALAAARPAMPRARQARNRAALAHNHASGGPNRRDLTTNRMAASRALADCPRGRKALPPRDMETPTRHRAE